MVMTLSAGYTARGAFDKELHLHAEDLLVAAFNDARKKAMAGRVETTLGDSVAGKTIACTLLELLTNPVAVAAARAEFLERTSGARYIAPLLPRDFTAPIEYRWPEYATTVRGEDWWIPASGDLGAVGPA